MWTRTRRVRAPSRTPQHASPHLHDATREAAIGRDGQCAHQVQPAHDRKHQRDTDAAGGQSTEYPAGGTAGVDCRHAHADWRNRRAQVHLTSRLATTAARLLRDASLRTLLLSRAARQGRGLILLWHRILRDDEPGLDAETSVVPAVRASLLRAQLQALRTIGDIVPLAQVVSPRAGTTSDRLRIALTFDDDEPSHLHSAASILRALQMPATFFLCGRALHELEAPWWIVLEQQVAVRGLPAVAIDLGLRATSAAALAAACEGTSLVTSIDERFAADAQPAQLTREDIAALAATPGVEIGFHTLRHQVLPTLSEPDLDVALREGRDTLAAVTGQPLMRFAYPHGKVDARVAAAAHRHGFAAAVASGQRAVNATSDAMTLSRWEPGALAPDALLAHLALRVSLPIPHG